MSDFIHCNVCFRLPAQGSERYPFYLTSCSHIICGKCLETAPRDQCLQCKKHARILKINRTLRADLRMYFRDPKELLQKYVRNLNAVLDFQNGHRQHLQKAKKEQQKKAMKYVMMAQLAIKQKAERERQASFEKDSLTRRIEKLRHRTQRLEHLLFARSATPSNGLRTPHSVKSTKSCPASTERSGRSFSRPFATSTLISDRLESDRFKLGGSGRSLSHVSAAFSRAAAEPSLIARNSAAITTPDMLGINKHSEREDNWLGGV